MNRSTIPTTAFRSRWWRSTPRAAPSSTTGSVTISRPCTCSRITPGFVSVVSVRSSVVLPPSGTNRDRVPSPAAVEDLEVGEGGRQDATVVAVEVSEDGEDDLGAGVDMGIGDGGQRGHGRLLVSPEGARRRVRCPWPPVDVAARRST
jgi:hypothetical protein